MRLHGAHTSSTYRCRAQMPTKKAPFRVQMTAMDPIAPEPESSTAAASRVRLVRPARSRCRCLPTVGALKALPTPASAGDVTVVSSESDSFSEQESDISDSYDFGAMEVDTAPRISMRGPMMRGDAPDAFGRSFSQRYGGELALYPGTIIEVSVTPVALRPHNLALSLIHI